MSPRRLVDMELRKLGDAWGRLREWLSRLAEARFCSSPSEDDDIDWYVIQPDGQVTVWVKPRDDRD